MAFSTAPLLHRSSRRRSQPWHSARQPDFRTIEVLIVEIHAVCRKTKGILCEPLNVQDNRTPSVKSGNVRTLSGRTWIAEPSVDKPKIEDWAFPERQMVKGAKGVRIAITRQLNTARLTPGTHRHSLRRKTINILHSIRHSQDCINVNSLDMNARRSVMQPCVSSRVVRSLFQIGVTAKGVGKDRMMD